MKSDKRGSLKAWLVWGAASFFILYQFLLQVSPSAMGTQLEGAFDVGVVSISNLSALFYYSFSLMLIPAGILLDRYPINRLLCLATVLCAGGCIGLGASPSILMAEISRLIMGMGAAFAFIGSLRLIVAWFPPQRVGLLSGLTVASAMLGAIFGQALFAQVVAMFYWRDVMWVLGLIGVGIAVLILLVVDDGQSSFKSRSTVRHDLLAVVHNIQSWKTAVFASLIYVPLPTFAGIWAMPYLVHVDHLSIIQAASICSMVWAGMGIGGPLTGWLSDYFGRRSIFFSCNTAAVLVLAMCVLYIPHLSIIQFHILFFALGFCCGAYSLSFALMREVNPIQVSGMALAFATMCVMLGVATISQLIGLVMRQVESIYTDVVMDYHLALMVVPICLLLAFVVALFLPETHCRQLEVQ